MTAASVTVTLPADEAQHLTRVLRLGLGDDVQVLNGRGLLRAGRVTAVSKDGVTLELGAELAAAEESRIPVTLAQALLKGDKMDDVVRDAAMAGAAAIQPLITARTEPKVVQAAARRLERWRTIAIGSAKQSGRAMVPGIAAATSLGDLLETDQGRCVVLVEPSAILDGERSHWGEPPERATLFVGPEGGWSADEFRLFARAGATRVTMPGPTWRADAVGLIALVLADLAWRGRSGWGV